MDPYLESHWGDVHARLIIYSSDQLQKSLPKDLRARVEERVFVESSLDDPITETFVEIPDLASGGRLVTVLEILSPTNKTPGEAQEKYLQKRHELYSGEVNLVEIDLLRGGDWVLAVPQNRLPLAATPITP